MKYFNKLYILFSIVVLITVSATNIRYYSYYTQPKESKKIIDMVLAFNPTKVEGIKSIYSFTDIGVYLNERKYSSGFKSDNEFISSLNDSYLMHYMEANNLPNEFYSILAKAVSYQHLESLRDWAMSDIIDKITIAYTLNDRELSVAVTLMHLMGDINTIVSISLLIILYFLIKLIIRYLIKIYKKLKIKALNASIKYDAYRVKKITEEELIRNNVKKSILHSEDTELEDLQNLINKAIEKGDSETAQVLLKILNSKKK